LGQDRLQVPFAEDQHPVGDLGPDREHEPFRIGIGPASSTTPDPHDRYRRVHVTHPFHLWFSVASRSISAVISALTGGCPAWCG
jgi:hypothetical protein